MPEDNVVRVLFGAREAPPEDIGPAVRPLLLALSELLLEAGARPLIIDHLLDAVREIDAGVFEERAS